MQPHVTLEHGIDARLAAAAGFAAPAPVVDPPVIRAPTITSDTPTDPPPFEPEDYVPGPWITFMVLLVAIGITILAERARRARALERLQRWNAPTVFVVWSVTLGMIIERFLAVDAVLPLVARVGVVLGALVVMLPLLWDAVAGVALALEGRYALGDDVRVRGHEGRIIAMGLRSVILRARDGTESAVPNRRFSQAEVVRLNLTAQDAPCEWLIDVPAGEDIEAFVGRAREAALLSPFASPGSMPEVLVVAAGEGGVRLSVRGYVFDREQDERYRADVLARLGRASAGSAAPPKG